MTGFRGTSARLPVFRCFIISLFLLNCSVIVCAFFFFFEGFLQGLQVSYTDYSRGALYAICAAFGMLTGTNWLFVFMELEWSFGVFVVFTFFQFTKQDSKLIFF